MISRERAEVRRLQAEADLAAARERIRVLEEALEIVLLFHGGWAGDMDLWDDEMDARWDKLVGLNEPVTEAVLCNAVRAALKGEEPPSSAGQEKGKK